ncbi:hypothetical protein [Planococcus lenghuensis]|uniref:Uncharacterized protein n=1 Tax=Planococcus lenghuensis TaxID=2213202 RepID=A0A1Q2KY30_9BACL|nr:hypothetical protein [Planococcus lenghuensis]AQQ53120.1 hypothetical protein B0X71_08445 [Planococcus lenghuensis]
MKKQFDSILIAVPILVIMSSFFLPFVLVGPVQQALFQPESNWFFYTPFINYIICFASLLLLGIILAVFRYIYASTEQKKPLLHLVFVLALIPGVIGVAFSVDHYYYLDDTGIAYSGLLQFGQESEVWEDVESLVFVTKSENGKAKGTELIFKLENNTGLVFNASGYLSDERKLIQGRLNDLDIATDSVFEQRES